jgi:glycosyltransferase 2 family protein
MEQKKPESRFSVKRILRLIIIAIAVGLATNIILVFVVKDEPTFFLFQDMKIAYFLVPLLAFSATYLINAFRLKIVFTQYNIRIPFREAFRNSLLGNFFDNISPLAAGGQPFQIYHLQALGADSKTSANVILSRFVENAVITVLIVLFSLGRIIRMVRTLHIGESLVYLGLASTFLLTLFLILLLIRPDFLGRIALGLEKSFIGKIAHRISKKKDWASRVYEWSKELKEDVRFLWKEKLHIMLFDTFLGFLLIFVNSFSLYYALRTITGVELSLFEVFITFIIVWQVVFYIPTPGASGSVEAGFILVFTGFTGLPRLTQTAVLIWRFSTYYVLIGIGLLFFISYIKKKPKRLIFKMGSKGEREKTVRNPKDDDS